MLPSGRLEATPLAKNAGDDFKFTPVPLIPDQPVDELESDYLGLMPWAKMIAGSVVGTRGPFTIGVHGEWGYGKTSLLRLTKALIDGITPMSSRFGSTPGSSSARNTRYSPLIAAIADEIENKTIARKARCCPLGRSVPP